MFLTISFMLFSMALATLILLAGTFLGMNSPKDREKSSPFECGFDPKKSARIPFSLRFFLLTILFLVFDIEIVLIMPLPLALHSHNAFSATLASLLFMLILVLGLLHEWNEGSLEWAQ